MWSMAKSDCCFRAHQSSLWFSVTLFLTDDERRRPDVFSALKLGELYWILKAKLQVNHVWLVRWLDDYIEMKNTIKSFYCVCSPICVCVCWLREFAACQRDLGRGSHSSEFIQSGGSVTSHDGSSERSVRSGAADGGEECRHRQTRWCPRVDCFDAGHLSWVRQNCWFIVVNFKSNQ